MRRYPQEHIDFIAENYIGITTAELAARVNSAFGTKYTIGQIRAYKKNHSLSSGVKPGARESYYSDVFPREVCEYIHANYHGTSHADMAARLYAEFGREYTTSQIKGFYGNHKLNSGRTGRFEKGYEPKNKGKKGSCPAGCEKGWFKKGNIPQTHKPVGTEFLRGDGYWWVKIAEPNTWRQKHVLIWEAAHGKRPAGHNIIFLDGDRNNLALENLRLVTKAEHAVMSHEGYRSSNAAFTETGILLARVKMAKTAAKKRTRLKRRRKGRKHE